MCERFSHAGCEYLVVVGQPVDPLAGVGVRALEVVHPEVLVLHGGEFGAGADHFNVGELECELLRGQVIWRVLFRGN